LRVGAKGAVKAWVEGDPLPAGFARCLEDVAKSIPSLYEEPPGTELTVPLVFSVKKEP
jgi:hypothetical protein